MMIETKATDTLLNMIFRFKYKHPSTNQTAAACKELAKRFCGFVGSFETNSAEDALSGALNGVDFEKLDELNRVCEILGRDGNAAPKRGDIWIERWFPEYGCVLVMEGVGASSLALKLVYLDDWEHVLHSQPGGEYAHSAKPNAFSVLRCDQIKMNEKMEFMKAFDADLVQAVERSRLRSPLVFELASGTIELKHHKTPQFIAMLISLEIERQHPALEKVVARGGTTDVGVHTGCSAKDTCWPLVQGILMQYLPPGRDLFDKTMLLFKMHLLQAHMGDLETKTGAAFSSHAQDAFAMLQDIGLGAVPLIRRGLDAEAFEERCIKLRSELMKHIDKETARTAAQYRLPNPECLKAIAASLRDLEFNLPVVGDTFEGTAASARDESSIRVQLGFLDFVDPQTCAAENLLEWISYLKTVAASKKSCCSG